MTQALPGRGPPQPSMGPNQPQMIQRPSMGPNQPGVPPIQMNQRRGPPPQRVHQREIVNQGPPTGGSPQRPSSRQTVAGGKPMPTRQQQPVNGLPSRIASDVLPS